MCLSEYEKETILLTSEGDDFYDIQVYDSKLKRRLTEFAAKYPDLCRITRKDSDGCIFCIIDKSRVSIRLIPPYSDERKNAARECAKKLPRKLIRHNYQCGKYNRFGKRACTSHYIKMKEINAIVLADILSLTHQVIENEDAAKLNFLAKKQSEHAKQTFEDKKHLSDSRHRLDELSNLIPKIYEDKVLGKVPEDVCIDLLQKYTTEQKELNAIVADLEAKQQQTRKDEEDVEKFVSRLKKYADATELTREMCLELIEYIVVDEYAADRDRHIEIYYKFLDMTLENKNHLNLPQSA